MKRKLEEEIIELSDDDEDEVVELSDDDEEEEEAAARPAPKLPGVERQIERSFTRKTFWDDDDDDPVLDDKPSEEHKKRMKELDALEQFRRDAQEEYDKKFGTEKWDIFQDFRESGYLKRERDKAKFWAEKKKEEKRRFGNLSLK